MSPAHDVVPRSPALDVDALLDDRSDQGHRVLRLRRRRQDHDRGGPRRCARPSAGATSSCSPSTPRAGSRSRSASTELDNDPRPVDGRRRRRARSRAMMLDMKRTFDEFVESNADAERAAAILANPFYLSLSSSFAGTQEYMAMEKLGQLRARAEAEQPWDLIVVDTPPSRSALDFLDAPRRLGSFLDGRFIRMLAAPAKAGGRGVLQGDVRRLRDVHLRADAR